MPSPVNARCFANLVKDTYVWFSQGCCWAGSADNPATYIASFSLLCFFLHTHSTFLFSFSPSPSFRRKTLSELDLALFKNHTQVRFESPTQFYPATLRRRRESPPSFLPIITITTTNLLPACPDTQPRVAERLRDEPGLDTSPPSSSADDCQCHCHPPPTCPPACPRWLADSDSLATHPIPIPIPIPIPAYTPNSPTPTTTTPNAPRPPPIFCPSDHIRLRPSDHRSRRLPPLVSPPRGPIRCRPVVCKRRSRAV